MVLKGFTRRKRPYEVLSDEEIETVHRGTLEVLENTGVTFQHRKALTILSDNGCRVDEHKQRAHIPDYLVEECIRKCPSSCVRRARDAKNNIRIGGNTLYFATGCGMDTVDLDTWEIRIPTKQDQNNAVRVADALENIHFIAFGPYLHFEGVNPLLTIPVACASRIRNSTKAIMSESFQGSERWNIRMAKMTGQELDGPVSASSPLAFSKDSCNALFNFADAGFSVHISSGTIYGGSGPATLAGSMITSNAELLAGMVLAQLVKPGIGIMFLSFTHPLDMRWGIPIFGAIEKGIFTMMFNQICRNYRIPCYNSVGYSSSKVLDYQAGYEKAMQTLLCALSGANLIDMVGSLYGELTYHPAISVVDNDVCGMVGRILEGVEVTDETLGIDLIEDVGPVPGNYLSREHTRKWWKKEQFMPMVADRLPYPEWIKKGKKNVLSNAKQKVKEILATHIPTPLPKDQDEGIEEILKEAGKCPRE